MLVFDICFRWAVVKSNSLELVIQLAAVRLVLDLKVAKLAAV